MRVHGREREGWLDEVEHRMEAILCPDGDMEHRKTADEVFDTRTLMILSKFISGGHIDTVDFPIATGKEGNVFHATDPDGKSLALKIYRTSNANFKAITNYILGDPRFSGITKDRRQLLATWCSKEYRNLLRMQKAGVRVPEPVKARENILIMEYIGDENGPAPLLKQVNPRSIDNPQELYEDVLENLRLTYVKAGMVHADISEYNLLLHNGEIWIMDVAQGVLIVHPMAEEWLRRDVTNVCNFFAKIGAETDLNSALAFVRGKEGEGIKEDNAIGGGE